MDFVSKEKRSAIMRGVKAKNTRPELRVRSALHRLGYRFRLHCNDLPGKPDICLRAYRTVIFVHGCFWHQHEGCREGRKPDSNREFWLQKFEATRKRDVDQQATLRAAGWHSEIIWECDTVDGDRLTSVLERMLKRQKRRSNNVGTSASLR